MVKYVIAMEHSDRGNPEDQSMSAHTHYCGVNVPDETGKISQSDKRGLTVNKQYVILRFTEGSPGRAKLAEFSLLPLTYFVPKIRSPASPKPGTI